MAIDYKLKWEIKAWRKHIGLTQERLADLAGTTKSMISEMENGHRRLNDDHIQALCLAFGIEAADLLSPPDSIKGGIPLISTVSAGGVWFADFVDEAKNAKRIHVPDLPDGDWVALKVDGDSMDLISPAGSIIVINLSDKVLVSGAFYVIGGDDGATYKRFRAGLKDTYNFEPCSSNRAHSVIQLEREPRVYGRVRKTILDL